MRLRHVAWLVPVLCAASPEASSGTPPDRSVPGLVGEPAKNEIVEVLARGDSPPSAHFAQVAPGISVARVRAHSLGDLPASTFSVLPRLELTSDLANPIIHSPEVHASGLTGRGTVVGIVDGGFELHHPALRDPDGGTRFRWLVDYTRRITGTHPDLEARFAIPDCFVRDPQNPALAGDGKDCVVESRCADSHFPCTAMVGAIYAKSEIDQLLEANPPDPLAPRDANGHGTLVTSLAAGTKIPGVPYYGVAPEADLVGVSAGGTEGGISPVAVLAGMSFIFDRAAAMDAPAVVNLSLGGSIVPRDVPDEFADAILAMTGPGRVVVASAGNSGNPSSGHHQTVHLTEGVTTRLPFHVFIPGSELRPVEVLVTPHAGSSVRIGCDSAAGPWVLPIAPGFTRSAVLGESVASVIWKSEDLKDLVSPATASAVVQLQGPEASRASLVLEGTGVVDAYIETRAFDRGVREHTVGTPAQHPEMIAVGASAARSEFRSAAGEEFTVLVTTFDEGTLIPNDKQSPPLPGQVGSFSSAGPGLGGVIKPDLLAPGVFVVGAASRAGGELNVFRSMFACPPLPSGQPSSDPWCALVDAEHGAAYGTSFAAPFVSGAAALLLQRAPALTQSQVRVALQSGVHPSRSPRLYPESASVGELDVLGALAVVERMTASKPPSLPSPTTSWLTPNSHYILADGTRPFQVLIHLRDQTNLPADGFDVARVSAWLDGRDLHRTAPHVERVGPGLWRAIFEAPRDRVGESVRVGASFDGVDVVAPVTLPVALDPWEANYPFEAQGGCSLGRPSSFRFPWTPSILFVFFVLWRRTCLLRRDTVDAAASTRSRARSNFAHLADSSSRHAPCNDAQSEARRQ